MQFPPGSSPIENGGRAITQEVIDSRLSQNGISKEKMQGKLKSDAPEVDQEERPESPSPDYSNTPSPIPDRRRVSPILECNTVYY